MILEEHHSPDYLNIGMDTSLAPSDYSSGNSLAVKELSVTDKTNEEIPLQQEAERQLHQTSQYTTDFLANFPFYLYRFITQNRRAIINTLLALALFITLRLVFAVLDVLDDIPLLSPLLQLVGLGYSLWFANRYLLKAESRRELLQRIQGVTRGLATPSSGLLQADPEFQG
jgi:hypothetical protein